MTMNGVKVVYNLLSWLISGVLFSNLYIIPTIILFKHTFNEIAVVPYLHYGNAFIFWLTFIAHIFHLISFGMHVAAYFAKRKYCLIK